MSFTPPLIPHLRALVRQLELGPCVVEPDTDIARALAWAIETIDAGASVQAGTEGNLGEAQRQLAEALGELAYYADPATYLQVPAETQIAADRGARARAALQKHQGI